MKAVDCSGLTQRFASPSRMPWWRLPFLAPERVPSVTVLDDISLSVEKSRFLGIIGRNGAGKSTLLRVLAGVLEPSRGRVTVLGSRTGIFELGGIGNRFLSGRDYARRFLALNGVWGRHAADMLPGIHEFSELGAKFDDALITYSSGMLSRLYFSVATSVHSDVYFIDELLSVGDEHFQAKCWRRLGEMRTRGASGVLVTHDWSAVLKVCHEACLLESGRIVGRGTPEDVVQLYLAPMPMLPGAAAFLTPPRQEHRVAAGEGPTLKLAVELLKDLPLALGFSVEAIGGSIGWQVLLIQNFNPVADKAGRYEVALRLPARLLAPGRYLLNVFLTSPSETYGRNFHIYDARSWSLGCPDTLIVEGEPAEGATALRFAWSEALA